MDKLIISKEQEEALLLFKKSYTFEDFIKSKDKPNYFFSQLQPFIPEQIALLLCGWYTVEEPFKVGDWVTYDNGPISGEVTRQIKELDGDAIACFDGDRSMLLRNIRKATPEEIAQEKQRRFWKELGREVNQYNVGDIFSFEDDFHKVTVKKDNSVVCEMGEHFLKSEIDLVCPVEKRVDI